jgi:hypothetical protein
MAQDIDPKLKKKVMVKKPVASKSSTNSNNKKDDDNFIQDDVQGILIDKKTNIATPKAKPRVFVVNKQAKTTKVIDANNKVIFDGRNDNTEGKRKLDSITKDTERTMEQRESNARFYNTGSSKKQPKII